jgi:hypothetical protein
MSTVASLRRLHVALVAVLVLGALGGWATVLMGWGGLWWPMSLLSGLGTSIALVLLTRAVVAASTKTPHSDWVALGIGGCLPVVRIFVEIALVRRMARAVAATVDDEAIVRRATALIITRSVLHAGQSFAPALVFAVLPLGQYWYVAACAAGLGMVVRFALATYVVVGPLIAHIENARPVHLGGAGNDEPVAISTVR